ncbi:MAG TPA: hypothetical protein PKA28_05565 [Methylomusa anaerophila]|nr:hypothetical protein [Methylomusa anaerophila]HML87900.1 hypothetical protein [Methylomusa anaerophila]
MQSNQWKWKDLAQVMRQKVFIDGRNMFDNEKRRPFGFTYLGVGC